MTISEFFDIVVNGRIELRAIGPEGAVGRLFGGDLQHFIDQFNGHANVYFGVLPRPLPKEVGTLWVDIDFKTSDEASARALLAKFEPKPHIVVVTGGGLHVYWLIDPPIAATLLKPTLRAIATTIGGDPASTDLARILRVPGTLNVKYDPPRECFIEYVADSLFPYHFDDFGLEIAEEDIKQDEVPADYERSEASFSKAIAIVQGYIPAVEGLHGDEHTFKLCAALVRDCGLSEDEAFEILRPWNAQCRPPWDEGDLRLKIENARNYGKGAIGSGDPAVDFKEVAEEEQDTSASDAFAEMDERFHVVNDSGQVRLYEEGADAFGPCWQSYDIRAFIDVATMVYKYGMAKVKSRGLLPKARLWLEDKTRPNKKVYAACAFDPSNHVPETTFNLWRGLINPVKGDWSLFEELIFDILASKDKKVFEYIMNWCALSVQRPWEKPRTTIIFRGIEGTGKSIFGETFIALFGRHGTKLDKPDQLVGRFNEHLRDKVGIFVDEAFWSRDHKQEGVIKGLITDAFSQYEGKFKPVVAGKSYVHVVMASNNEHVARIVGLDSRRYAVFNVETKKSREWYRALVDARSSIAPAWLHSLLARNISTFEPDDDRPKTAAYQEQMDLSRDPIHAWLLAFVENNYEDPMVPVVKTFVRGRVFRTEDVRASIVRFLKESGERVYERSYSVYIGRKLTKLLPTLRRGQVLVDKNREVCYIFPSLEEARQRLNIEEIPIYEEDEDLI